MMSLKFEVFAPLYLAPGAWVGTVIMYFSGTNLLRIFMTL